jgi:hypothetical protein
MILRVYALYKRDRRVLLGLSLIFLAQIAVQARVLLFGVRECSQTPVISWLLKYISSALEFPVPTGCILIGRTSLFTGLWIAPLFTDSSIFILTLLRSREYFQQSARMPYVTCSDLLVF